MKRSVIILLSLLFSSVFLTAAVSAAGNTGMSKAITSISDIVTSIYDVGVQPLAQFLIGPDSAGDATKFFTLVLFLAMLFAVLWEITDRVPILSDSAPVQFVVSLAISVIAVRFLGQAGNASWFETILLPNQTLGIALLCLFPLVIYFFFVLEVGRNSRTLAKILWIFAAVLFAVLYFTRADEIGASSSGFNPATVYAIAAVCSLVFLLADGTIRRYAERMKTETAISVSHAGLARQLMRDIHQLDADWAAGLIIKSAYEAEKKSLLARYEKLKAP